jgi:hypothetical protein
MNPAFAFLAQLRLWTLLLLAAIGLQAAVPIRAPLERVQGSAFSASTLDVALTTARRAWDQRANLAQPMPAAPPSAIEPRPILPTFALAEPAHLRPEARGPPPRSHPARLPDSTAPPLA